MAATFFTAALARYVVGRNQPGLSAAQLEREAAHIILPFDAVATFHRIKFHAIDARGFRDSSSTVDSVHSQPSRKDKRGHTIPACFDTVLVNEGDGGITGVNVFTLTSKAMDLLFPAGPVKPPAHLAYVEWFTPFQQPESHHGLYKISRLMRHGERLASIIDVSDIRRSVHLFPNFGAVVPREWTSSTVLELCSSFFFSKFPEIPSFLRRFVKELFPDGGENKNKRRSMSSHVSLDIGTRKSQDLQFQPRLYATLITIEVRDAPDQGPNRSQTDSSGVPPDSYHALTGKSAPHKGRVMSFHREWGVLIMHRRCMYSQIDAAAAVNVSHTAEKPATIMSDLMH
ncbi:hypothetical protein F4604DRAFT_1984324 [Suillus subluteus]|nr:hypothetical protein F4604DRAFT_1984324 [Suillus subluteus]